MARAQSVLLACTVFSTAPLLHAAPLDAEIRSALQSVPHSKAVSGICVIDLSNGQTVFQRKADRSLIPASNMKVFVMAAALLELGADFEFETTFASNGVDLALIGDGDPGLGDAKIDAHHNRSQSAVFEEWAKLLVDRGLTEFTGDLLIDDTLFDTERTHPSWDPRDLGKWFAAPVGALNFNNNCVDISVSPARKPGLPAIVTVFPESSLIDIVNRCKTGTGKKPVVHHPPGTYRYKISGRCNKRWPFGAVAFPDPGMLTADTLRTSLAKQRIKVAGRLKRQRIRKEGTLLPEDWIRISSARTSIVDVLRRTGKDSQNLFAECLLKRLGYSRLFAADPVQAQGSWESGGNAIREILNSISAEGFVVADGSGLSRDNRCTARQLAQTYAAMHRSNHAELFMASLSVAGVDGSLRKRLKDHPHRIYGKTGTMRGIRTLSGYATDGARRRFAFAIIFNGYKGPSTPYREIQDRICRSLINSASKGG